MNPDLNSHPAVLFGSYLKGLRLNRREVSRIFANQIELAPSKYAEVELGIIKWFGEQQEKLVSFTLGLTVDEQKTLSAKLSAAREAGLIGFSDVFTRESLRPVRLRLDGAQVTGEVEEQILDEVFADLV